MVFKFVLVAYLLMPDGNWVRGDGTYGFAPREQPNAKVCSERAHFARKQKLPKEMKGLKGIKWFCRKYMVQPV